MDDRQAPPRPCGWCMTRDHIGCVKGRRITGTCGCTAEPGLCGGDTR